MEAYSELSALENKCLARVLARVLATPTTRNRGGGGERSKKKALALYFVIFLLFFCSFLWFCPLAPEKTFASGSLPRQIFKQIGKKDAKKLFSRKIHTKQLIGNSE